MKIAVVDPAAYSLPYDTALCAALARRGHEVTLFTTRFAHGAMPAAEGFELVEWFYRRPLRMLPRRIARGLQHGGDVGRLCQHLLREGYDIVHVEWQVFDQMDSNLWHHLAIPTVFTAHNAVSREERASVDPKYLARYDAVIAHSHAGAEALRAALSDTPVWQLAHGTLDRYRDAPEPAEPPIGLDDGPVVALTGVLRPYKGVDTLLAAWPLVRSELPDAQLVIAGRAMGIELPQTTPDGVHILARFVDDADFAWILRRADLVCLPYRAIDLSGVLFSALALGKPLLLSDVGGFQEFEGQGARLVEPDNAPALAAQIVALLEDRDELARLATESAHAGTTTYDWDRIADGYEQHYAELRPHG